ncbi:hypothetical protein [Methanosarcina horonobensis]|uniref:hypothetical protein n=2 Tax=Methanosarcina horonobensis TaxID=418008 RepID=UPI0013019109|nr:hypothetical protein [Methanosarcina horonobensis]
MNKRKFSGAKKLYAKGSHAIVSNLRFHSKIIEKYSGGKKRFFSFPFLLFRENSEEKLGRRNKFSFPIHIQVLKYPVSRETVSSGFTEKKVIIVNQSLKPVFLKEKEKEREILRTYENVTNTRDIIRQNNGDTVQRSESVIQKTAYDVQKEIRALSRNGNFHPVSGSLPDTNLANIVRKKVPKGDLLRNPIGARMAENSVFRPYVFYQGRSLKSVNQINFGDKTSGESFEAPSWESEGISKLSRLYLRNVDSGMNSPGRNPVYEDISVLNPIPFSRSKVSLRFHLAVPSVSAFDEGLILDSASGKGTYHQAPGLVFNSAGNLSQEIEREMEAIKEELAQAEKAARESYSSIYSKMEEELKRNLEINKISEQVIRQITMRLKIEKERRGLL